jgi:hypothetical protein
LCAGSLGLFQQLQTLCDNRVSRVEFRRSSICINGIRYLIVAAFVKAPKIEPNFGDIWIDTNGARVRVEGIPILVDLEVKHANRTPECRVPAITIHGLLVSLVCFVVLLAGHVSTPKEIPTLGVMRV